LLTCVAFEVLHPARLFVLAWPLHEVHIAMRPWSSGRSKDVGAAIVGTPEQRSISRSPGPLPVASNEEREISHQSQHPGDCPCVACETHRAFHALLREDVPPAVRPVRAGSRSKGFAPRGKNRPNRPEWNSSVEVGCVVAGGGSWRPQGESGSGAADGTLPRNNARVANTQGPKAKSELDADMPLRRNYEDRSFSHEVMSSGPSASCMPRGRSARPEWNSDIDFVPPPCERQALHNSGAHLGGYAADVTLMPGAMLKPGTAVEANEHDSDWDRTRLKPCQAGQQELYVVQGQTQGAIGQELNVMHEAMLAAPNSSKATPASYALMPEPVTALMNQDNRSPREKDASSQSHVGLQDDGEFPQTAFQFERSLISESVFVPLQGGEVVANISAMCLEEDRSDIEFKASASDVFRALELMQTVALTPAEQNLNSHPAQEHASGSKSTMAHRAPCFDIAGTSSGVEPIQQWSVPPIDEQLVECPTCGRRLTSQAAERHIQKCLTVPVRSRGRAKEQTSEGVLQTVSDVDDENSFTENVHIEDSSSALSSRIAPADGDRFPGAATPEAEPSMEDEGSAEPLHPCPRCSRSFTAAALSRHAAICQRVFGQRRRQFDAAGHRQAEGAAEVCPQRQRGRQSGAREQPAAANNWRAQSEAFRQAMRDARRTMAHMAAGRPLSELPMPAASALEMDDRVECPHCGRRFGCIQAERHIPRCASRPSRLARRSVSVPPRGPSPPAQRSWGATPSSGPDNRRQGRGPMQSGLSASEIKQAHLMWDSSAHRGRLDDCSVCLGNATVTGGWLTLPCKHTFHKECVEKWLIKQSLCPLCRHDVRPHLARRPASVEGRDRGRPPQGRRHR